METTVIDPGEKHVVAFDRHHAIENDYGTVTIRVRTDRGEHHATNKAAARKWLALVLPDYRVTDYVRTIHMRDFDGLPSTWKVYATEKVS